MSERVAGLPYELRDILATISVAGRGVGSDILSHVHGISRIRASALGDALVERQLAAQVGGTYTCAHPIIADVVCAGLTTGRRQDLHRAIARSLQAITKEDESAAVADEIARHAQKAGEDQLAFRNALIASQAAEPRHSMEDALSWLDLAAAVAAAGDESALVSQQTARLLEETGWTEPPSAAKHLDTQPLGIEQDDVDLRSKRPRRTGPVTRGQVRP